MRHGKFIIALMVMFIITIIGSYSVYAGEYEITKIIEVGPAQPVPMTWPLKWSPDGTKLAFFNQNTLYLSDTLGNFKEIITPELSPYRYEWLSNREIIIHLMNRETETEYYRLVRLNIDTGLMTTLEEYERKLGVREKNDPNSFSGPQLTIEGRLYYRTNVLRATVPDPDMKNESQPFIFPVSDYKSDDDLLPAEKNHILSWCNDGLYMITCDLSDSIKLFPSSLSSLKLPPAISQDHKYIMVRSKICNLSSKECISIKSYLERPVGLLSYGFLYYSFNPIDTEVLFQLVCEKNRNLEDGKPYEEDKDYEEFSMAIFNYETKNLMILDTLIGYESCLSPAISPDGYKIAFISDGKCHIMYRE